MKDGGPAFPTTDGESYTNDAGMTLRDWFAGMSLARLVHTGTRAPAEVAALAYDIADAMLREKETKP